MYTQYNLKEMSYYELSKIPLGLKPPLDRLYPTKIQYANILFKYQNIENFVAAKLKKDLLYLSLEREYIIQFYKVTKVSKLNTTLFRIKYLDYILLENTIIVDTLRPHSYVCRDRNRKQEKTYYATWNFILKENLLANEILKLNILYTSGVIAGQDLILVN